MPEFEGKQSAGGTKWDKAAVLHLKCWLTNRKQHEDSYGTKAKASECSGRGNRNNDSALPPAAIRVDKQEGQILIGSSFGLRGKLCQVEICMR